MLPSGSDRYEGYNCTFTVGIRNGEQSERFSRRKWTLKDMDIGRTLGRGRFGLVCLAREKRSRFVVALKIMNKSDLLTPDLMQQLQREIEIQSHLMHTNIVRLYSYFYDHKRIYLLLEYVPKGELSKDISRFGQFSDARVATHLYQLSMAISYCHQKDVIHRDIKPENILLGIRGEVKLTDFGCAVHKPASRRTALFGTLNYLAPEMVDPESIHEHYVDIWSLGVLTYEMLCGYLPFVGTDADAIGRQILFTDPRCSERIQSDADLSVLVSKMLQKNPIDRVTLDELRSMTWLRKHAEFSLVQCTAALHDWETLNQNKLPSSSSPRFDLTDSSGHPSQHGSSTVSSQSSPDRSYANH